MVPPLPANCEAGNVTFEGEIQRLITQERDGYIRILSQRETGRIDRRTQNPAYMLAHCEVL
jgi:hypothetical protein